MGKSNDSGISSNLSDGVWGDYNNDGWLDVLINRNADKSLSFYKNNMNTGDEIFALQGVSLPQLTNGSIALGDLDNDGYLDILVTGESTLTDSSFSKIYRNIGVYQPNTTPDAPTNLQNTVNYSNITLKWDKGTDSQTPQNGLSYNIRIGTAPGGIDIVSPMASAVTGLRQKPDLGNAGQSTEVYTLTLPLGTYYWSVQAIDNAFAGGAWADENSFNVTSQQASNITVDSTSLYGLKLSWAKGNGDQRVVFVMEGDGKVAIPVNDTTYIPNNNFSSGTQIDLTGWYCVYNGTGTNVMITGLKEGTHYKVTVFEYSGTTGKENYNPGIGAGNVVLVETKQLFELQMGITLAFRHENYAWVDFNNDGWLDIFMTGCDVSGSFCGSVLYKNNGNGTFSEQTSFLGVGRDGGSIAWGDYNNDNYVDLMLSGYTGHGQGGWPTIVFKNNGDGTFTGPTYIDWNWSGSRWEDYNNDGRLDILLSHNSDGLSSAVYKNNGDGTFTKQTDSSSAGAKGIRRDYDNDGFRDIATGSHVFKNSDSITLSEQTDLVFSGKTEGPVVWGDYNNDGYLDKLIGDKVYKNNGAYLPEIRNMPPSAPTDLQYDIDLNSASLKWDKSTDAITPQDELSYNVRIGTNSGGFDIVSPAASIDNGKRWILEFGNAGQKNDGFLIKDLADGIYYWSVQAIDNDFAGGPWATEQTFSISKIGNSNFKFYPNPARDFITILQEEAQPCLITLIDFSGKIVLSRQINEKQENIQLYNLHKGFYILKLQTNNAVKTIKLVVK
jgi:hypothetical protein